MFNFFSKKAPEYKEIVSDDVTMPELLKRMVIMKQEKEISEVKRKFEDKDKDRLIAEKDLKITELKSENAAKTEIAVKEKTLDLQMEKNNLQAKVEILEKAFENLGFDVKDMKEILNKLVDGIISKNEINIIK